ncbi:hypothetical protein [Streptomyces narbonensis]|uniref:hypothetical protein n=1 Tax=Streptomyces narbonensis TaxID=67333 RepID=UPI00167B94E5|nr:hypothetical protein [Streptomyces narbonensis]
MNPRRALVALLAALLTSGCVAVPVAPAPATPARPAELAPAAERPPAALTDWPEPTEAPPRENLAVTDSERPGRAPAKSAPPTSAPAGHLPAARVPAGQRHPHTPGHAVEETHAGPGAPRRNPRTTTDRRTPGPVERKPARRTLPSPKSRPPQQSAPRPSSPRPSTARPSTARPASPSPRQPVNGQAPEMRALCRQAQEIDAPMGAAGLCRGMYGR